jgi:colanic acid/amylovoran biosynthesis glycosyltransferase
VPRPLVKTFAYLFERFPAFTQTFCAREVAELYRQGLRPPVFSIRRSPDTRLINVALDQVPIVYLPNTNSWQFKLSTKLVSPRTLNLWRQNNDTRDKNRYYEAVYLGRHLRSRGIAHLHVHFAGLAARTAWWIRRLYGISYSFTGHANDIFVGKANQRVPLEKLVNDAEFVVSVSDFGAAFLRHRVPAAGSKIHRVYNGLDLSAFTTVPNPSGPVKILAVGRLIPKKGFRDLITACSFLVQMNVPDFRCRIVGAGPEENELRQIVLKQGLEEIVSLAGEKNQEQLPAELAEAHVFALPCRHDQQGDSDNLPTVIIEAMAAGLPVVSTRLAGIPELVADKKNGLLIEENDPVALAGALEILIRDPGLRESYGIASRRLAESNFDIRMTVADLRGLFEGYLS